MQLIIGLGNPGKNYALNRHNVGFMALEDLAKKFNIEFSESKKFKNIIANINIEGKVIFLLKPNKFMNLSGESIWIIKNYYKIATEDILVIHDDLDLEFGKIKIKQGGSSGGHNGIKSLDSHIGNNYFRLRIGIGRPKFGETPADYVLSNFTENELEELAHLFAHIQKKFALLLNKSFESFLNLQSK
jgi:PTH1 family peptidyl-tRNA hydrolase